MYKVYGTDTKKMLNMLILEILKMYSDENHKLTQQEILRRLKSEYGVDKCDRRTVKANVKSLKQMGIEIYAEDGEAYYLMERDLEDEELRWLIDAVLFSKVLTETQAKRLIGKLEGFGNKYFKSNVSHVAAASGLSRTENKHVMINVSTINEAIDKKKKIRFRYKKYGADLKMHDCGKEYTVNPYQMVATNGRYYLIGNVDKYDNASYYRIDKISNVEILDEKIKPMKEIAELKNGLDLPKHMAEHIYMFHGESVPVYFKTTESMIDGIVDWFGKDVKITKPDKDSDEVQIRVMCNYDAMYYWALQYGPYVEIIEPQRLRDDIRKTVEDMARKYS